MCFFCVVLRFLMRLPEKSMLCGFFSRIDRGLSEYFEIKTFLHVEKQMMPGYIM